LIVNNSRHHHIYEIKNAYLKSKQWAVTALQY
jgi:hypothetical protein